jgi:hypothetical protein
MKLIFASKTISSLLFFSLILSHSFGQNNARLSEILFKQTGRDVKTINTSANLISNLFTGSVQTGKLQNVAAGALKDPQNNSVYGLEVNRQAINNLVSTKPNNLRLEIPVSEGRTVLVDFIKVNVGEFNVKDSRGADVTRQLLGSVHYQGVFTNDVNSIAAISFFSDGTVMGLLSSRGLGNRVIGKSSNTSTSHVIYNVEDLKLTKDFAFACGVNDDTATKENVQTVFNDPTANSTCKEIKIYFECDYSLFQSQGSTIQGTVQYMSGIFNQVKTLYANESINMIISEIKVWDATDPYVNLSSTSSVLSAFVGNLNGNYNGDIAHFISGRINTLGGGIANGIPTNLCGYGKANRCCVSAIYATYQPLPTYSWTVMVVTHEMGHILGSRHTHYCGWVGGAIDGCSGFAESDSLGNSCSVGPIPSVGGTTMSYCHQQSVGINMTLGFGPQPGNMIRNKIAISSCFTTSTSTPDPLNLQVLGVSGNTAQLQWDAVAGASYYAIEYRQAGSGAWLFAGVSNTNLYNLSGLNFNTSYEWRVRTSCSNFTQGTNFTTTQAEITINASLVPSTLCLNSTFTVNFTIVGSINANNIFNLVLVNSSNNITVNIGTLSGSSSGSIQGTIPNNGTILTGTYKLRIDASNPSVSSLLSTQTFTVSNTIADVPPTVSYGSITSNSATLTTQATVGGFTLYYVVVGQGATAPTASQILTGKASNNLPAVKSGQVVITNPNLVYTKLIDGLQQGTGYDVYISFSNSVNSCPASILKQTVMTLGNLTAYCSPTLKCTDGDYIAKFQIPTIGLVRSSTCDNAVTSYIFLNENAYNIPIGSTVSFTLNTGVTFAQMAFIWIDFNKDGVFDSSESVYTNNSAAYVHSGNIAVNSNATAGLTRMRVMVTYNVSDPNSCIATTNWGEIEDYLVDLGCTVTTATPTNLQVSNVGATKATVSWNAVAGSYGYTLRFKQSASAGWDSVKSTTATNYMIKNLIPSTAYNWEVSATCSPFVAGNSFTTFNGEIKLIAPTSLNFCKGASFNLAYSSILSSSITTLIAQLSNSSGSFANPQTIGSTNDILASGGGVNCFLNSNLTAGNYKIRVKTLPTSVVSDTLSITVSSQTGKSVSEALVSKVSNGNYKFKFKATAKGKIFFVVISNALGFPSYQQILAGKDPSNSNALLADSVSITDSTQYFSTIKKFTYQGLYSLYAVVRDNNSSCGQNAIQTIFYQSTGGSPGSGSYCSVPMYCESGTYISKLKISNTALDLQKTVCNSYSYLSTVYNLAMATPYTITVSSPSSVYLTIWIDKNNNNLFEPSEVLIQTSTTATTYSVPLNSTTNNILVGRYRMRAIIRVYGVSSDPCGAGLTGEAIDFVVNFGNPNCWDSPYATLISPLDDVSQNENLTRSAISFDAANQVDATGKLFLNYKEAIDLTPGFDSKNTSVFSIAQGNCPTLTTNSANIKPKTEK